LVKVWEKLKRLKNIPELKKMEEMQKFQNLDKYANICTFELKHLEIYLRNLFLKFHIIEVIKKICSFILCTALLIIMKDFR
jgi:hypothetical protein